MKSQEKDWTAANYSGIWREEIYLESTKQSHWWLYSSVINHANFTVLGCTQDYYHWMTSLQSSFCVRNHVIFTRDVHKVCNWQDKGSQKVYKALREEVELFIKQVQEVKKVFPFCSPVVLLRTWFWHIIIILLFNHVEVINQLRISFCDVHAYITVEPPVSGHPRDLVEVSAYGRLHVTMQTMRRSRLY